MFLFLLCFQALLETKSGPIQSLGVHDITKFYDQDLIVADSWACWPSFVINKLSVDKSCLIVPLIIYKSAVIDVSNQFVLFNS